MVSVLMRHYQLFIVVILGDHGVNATYYAMNENTCFVTTIALLEKQIVNKLARHAGKSREACVKVFVLGMFILFYLFILILFYCTLFNFI